MPAKARIQPDLLSSEPARSSRRKQSFTSRASAETAFLDKVQLRFACLQPVERPADHPGGFIGLIGANHAPDAGLDRVVDRHRLPLADQFLLEPDGAWAGLDD